MSKKLRSIFDILVVDFMELNMVLIRRLTSILMQDVRDKRYGFCFMRRMKWLGKKHHTNTLGKSCLIAFLLKKTYYLTFCTNVLKRDHGIDVEIRLEDASWFTQLSILNLPDGKIPFNPLYFLPLLCLFALCFPPVSLPPLLCSTKQGFLNSCWGSVFISLIFLEDCVPVFCRFRFSFMKMVGWNFYVSLWLIVKKMHTNLAIFLINIQFSHL